MTKGKLLPFRRISGNTEDFSDRALVAAVAEGDQVALRCLYDRFHRDVVRFLGHLLRRDKAIVEDLLQMTFLEAYRSAPRFRGDSSAKTWLFGIAANLVRTHFRGEQRGRAAMASLATIEREAPVSASEQMIAEQRRRWLAAAIDGLTPALREAYVLCAIEEVPGKEAAQALGITEGSLWRRLTDARAALRAAIEEMQR
jgi:RNA polymerase sigma-70 factor (ECF subfamily)